MRNPSVAMPDPKRPPQGVRHENVPRYSTSANVALTPEPFAALVFLFPGRLDPHGRDTYLASCTSAQHTNTFFVHSMGRLSPFRPPLRLPDHHGVGDWPSVVKSILLPPSFFESTSSLHTMLSFASFIWHAGSLRSAPLQGWQSQVLWDRGERSCFNDLGLAELSSDSVEKLYKIYG
jgi:hypothetical protein